MSTTIHRLRYITLILACLAPVLSGCRSLNLEHVPQDSEGDWLTEGSGETRQSAAGFSLALPLEEVWSYDAQAGFGQGSPLLLGQTVIVATRQGEIHAVDLQTGKGLGVKGFGEAIEGTPVIANGNLYVPVAWDGAALYAYDLRNGTVEWSRKGPPIETGLLIANGVLIAVDTGSRMYGLDLGTGEVRWERALDSTAAVLAAPVALDVTVAAVADDRGVVTAFDATNGSIRWQAMVEAPVQDTPAATAGLMYVPTTRGRLVALDTGTGREQWTFTLPDTTVYVASPAVQEDQIVFGASDGYVRALDAATGTVAWSTDVREGIASAPLLLDETVFVGAMDGTLYALNRETGAVEWKHALEGRIRSAPAAREGYLVVTSEPRNVYVFRPQQDQYAQTP